MLLLLLFLVLHLLVILLDHKRPRRCWTSGILHERAWHMRKIVSSRLIFLARAAASTGPRLESAGTAFSAAQLTASSPLLLSVTVWRPRCCSAALLILQSLTLVVLIVAVLLFLVLLLLLLPVLLLLFLLDFDLLAFLLHRKRPRRSWTAVIMHDRAWHMRKKGAIAHDNAQTSTTASSLTLLVIMSWHMRKKGAIAPANVQSKASFPKGAKLSFFSFFFLFLVLLLLLLPIPSRRHSVAAAAASIS